MGRKIVNVLSNWSSRNSLHDAAWSQRASDGSACDSVILARKPSIKRLQSVGLSGGLEPVSVTWLVLLPMLTIDWELQNQNSLEVVENGKTYFVLAPPPPAGGELLNEERREEG